MTNPQPIQITDQDRLADFCQAPGLPVLDPQAVAQHGADAHWIVTGGRGDFNARCSLWWREVPPIPGHRPGLIGHYAARDGESARQILTLAAGQLAAHGCSLSIGPMDGNTWRSHRLVTERGEEPAFLLEPDHPDEWPAHFIENGFSIYSEYFSTLNPDLGRPQPDLERVAERSARRGVTIRPFALDDFEGELLRIYDISLASFGGNLLYTPIDRAEFLGMYRPLQSILRPGLIHLAEQNGKAVGFIFAYPDLLQARRGQAVDTVVLKTVAVRPEFQILGVGNLLVARCQESAHQLGYRRAIHALMHLANSSRKVSQRHGSRPMRRYALFARPLPSKPKTNEHC